MLSRACSIILRGGVQRKKKGGGGGGVCKGRGPPPYIIIAAYIHAALQSLDYITLKHISGDVIGPRSK